MNNAVQLNIRRIFLRKKWRDNLLSRGVVNDSFQLREAWQERLQAPVFSKIKMGTYNRIELDRMESSLIYWNIAEWNGEEQRRMKWNRARQERK